MRCEKARILLSQELDGELGADERAALEQHLSGCPECQKIRQAYQSINAEVAGLEVEPPASLERDILEQIHSEPIPVRPRRRPMWGVGTAAAVAAVLALVIFSRTGLLEDVKYTSADSASATEEAMDTADNAHVDASTQLAAPEGFWDDEPEAEDTVVEDMETPEEPTSEYDAAAFDPILWAQAQEATVLLLEDVTPEQAELTGGEKIANGAVCFRVSETRFQRLLDQWDGTVYGEGADWLVLLLSPET